MANLKDTVVLGKLNVTDQVIANKIIKLGGTANEVLCADGSTTTLSGSGSGTVTSVGISNGGGLSVSGSPITGSGTITISHADTSSQASMTTGGRTYVNSITLDGYGHVTAIGTGTESNQDQDVTPPIFYLSSGQFDIATENYTVTDVAAQSQIEDSNCFCIIANITSSADNFSGTAYLYKSGIGDNFIWFQDAKVHWRESQTQVNSIGLSSYNMTITSMTPNTTSGRTTIEGRVTTDLTITEISGISLTCSMLGSGSQEFDLTIAKYTLSDGSFTFRGYIRSIGIQAVTEGEVECNATVPNGHPNYLTELRYNTTQHKFMWTRSA